MKKTIETDRLILRKIELSDAESLFEMDSNPEVLKYIGVPTTKSIEEVTKMILLIHDQYDKFNVGRWAVVDKNTNQFLGWSGLKFMTESINGHSNFYELGYRFLPQFWGKGYATESAKAWLNYAFKEIKCDSVYAMTDTKHAASINVLEKIGFELMNEFDYPYPPCEGLKTNWLKAEKNRS